MVMYNLLSMQSVAAAVTVITLSTANLVFPSATDSTNALISNLANAQYKAPTPLIKRSGTALYPDVPLQDTAQMNTVLGVNFSSTNISPVPSTTDPQAGGQQLGHRGQNPSQVAYPTSRQYSSAPLQPTSTIVPQYYSAPLQPTSTIVPQYYSAPLQPTSTIVPQYYSATLGAGLTSSNRTVPGWALDGDGSTDLMQLNNAQRPTPSPVQPLSVPQQQQHTVTSGGAVLLANAPGTGLAPLPSAANGTATPVKADTTGSAAIPQIPPGTNMTGQSLSADTQRLGLQHSVMTIEQIKAVLPHRYPFLLLDRVLYLEKGKRGVGVKQVSANEQFFEGHFPDKPVLPGVLQVEALAQLAGVVFSDGGRLFLFTGVQSVKWRRIVVPGDTLLLEVVVLSKVDNRGFVKCQGKGYVGGKVVVEVSEMTFKSVPR